MFIHEAVHEAVKKEKYITLKDLSGRIKIKPTNGPGNLIIMQADGSRPSKAGWQPSAEDLLRDDWIVID